MSNNYTINFDLSFIPSTVHVQQSKYIAELLKDNKNIWNFLFCFVFLSTSFLYTINYLEVLQLKII